MSLIQTKKGRPGKQSANKTAIFVDNNNRASTVDDKGVLSVLAACGIRSRNVLDNGGFQIQQKIPVASTAIAGISTATRAGVVADRWAVTTSTASNLNWQQVDTIAAPETGLNSRYYGQIIKSSAAKKIMLSQFIVGSDTADLRGKRVRASVKINQKVGAAQDYRLGIIQLNSLATVDSPPAFLSGAFSATTDVDPAWGTNTAPVNIVPQATIDPENGTIVGNFLNCVSTPSVWTKHSVCFDIPNDCKNLYFVLFSNAIGGTTDNLAVAEFLLTEGEEIFDYTEPPFQYTLARCQLFYTKSFPLAVVPAASIAAATGGLGAPGTVLRTGSGTANACLVNVRFTQRMFRTPTVSLFSPVGAGVVMYRHTGTTPALQGTTAIVANSTTDMGFSALATNEATTNGAIGDVVGLHYAASAEFVV
jgi:hypothetical protein